MTTFEQIHPLFIEVNDLTKSFPCFAQRIQDLAQIMNLALEEYEIDHIALRVNTDEKAKYWLTHLLKYGTILNHNIVNGRVIYLIKLAQPLRLAGQFIDIIELPFPKNKIYPIEGWEHIEVVMPFLQNETTEEWIKRVSLLFLWNQLDNLKVKVSEPKVEGEQLPNPSIAVSFVDNAQNHTCIKVHPYNIKKIIEV
ncbi:MAG: VOC family protein [Pasteurella oralis]|uniref:VOC family protein n=1 Tax=Pasteurella oralis TaxID=1071947 RepID=UPI000C7D5146|nr:VOC family protein [Pasteurella oralis]MDO5054854.1 VOC family protein [Pasteurella oralis]